MIFIILTLTELKVGMQGENLGFGSVDSVFCFKTDKPFAPPSVLPNVTATASGR